MVKKVMKLYAVGGTGLNICQEVEKQTKAKGVGEAIIDVSYIDTSRSNVTEDSSKFYGIPGLDGLGKLRTREAFEKVAPHAKAILRDHRPGDVNVIIHGAAGASGPIAGPCIAKEILDSDAGPLIVISVGSRASVKEIENTLGTIETYEGLSAAAKRPIVFYYMENTKTVGRNAVNKQIILILQSLAFLFSGENREMDTADLYNWINYERVTSFTPRLVSFEVFQSNTTIDPAMGHIISVASLGRDSDEETLGIRTEYRTSGILPEGMADNIYQAAPLHYVIYHGMLARVVASLRKELSEIGQDRDARLNDDLLVDTKKDLAGGFMSL